MRLAFAVTLLAFAVLVVPFTASAAGVTPLTYKVPINEDLDVDGTDVYWLSRDFTAASKSRESIFGIALMRGSLLNKSVTKLATYDSLRGDFPVSILASAGYVYLNLSNGGYESNGPVNANAKVVRMSRDGTGVLTVAKSSMKYASEPNTVVENGNLRLNDCGTNAQATSVSFTGDVVISQTTSDRESKACGRKKNIDHWSYYELTTSGVRRDITTEERRVTRRSRPSFKDGPPMAWTSVAPTLADPWVYYGKAVFQKFHDGDFYVRDLASGAVTGPYKTKIPGHDFYAYAAVNSLGQLAAGTEATTGKAKHEKLHLAAGVFRTPGDPSSYAKFKGSAGMQFCGDHLMINNGKGVRELDPNTFWLKRVVAGKESARGLSFVDPLCSDRFYYVTRYTKSKIILFAYPLE